MKKSDLIKLIEKLNDDQEVNDLLSETDIVLEALTLDKFKSRVREDKDFKSYLDSLNDTHLSKAIKTMKETGSWETEFNDALKTKYPDLVKDPMQIELMKERKAREDLEAKLARKDLLQDALKYANEKNLPGDFVEKFLGNDLDSTKVNLDEFAENWSKVIESAVDAKFKNSSYTPPGSSGSKVSIGASFAKQVNDNKTNGQDPWSKE